MVEIRFVLELGVADHEIARTIQFTKGQQIAGLKVSPLADDLSHIMISSAHSGSQPNAAALIQDNILRICKDMNVECSQAK